MRLSIAVQGVALSPDRRLLAVVLGDGTVSVLDTATEALLSRGTGHEGNPIGLSTVRVYFVRDGRLLTVGSDGTVRHWDVARWPRERRLLDAGRSARQLAASPDGKEWAAITAERELVRWGRDGKVLAALRWLGGGRPNAVAYVPGRRLAVVGQQLGGCTVLDLDSGKPLAQYGKRPRTNGEEAVTAVAVSPGGDIAASNWVDGSIDLWRVADGGHVRTLLHAPPPGKKESAAPFSRRVCSLAFRPDGKQLASVDTEGTLTLWKVASGEAEFAGLAGPPQTDLSCGLAYSPDGRHLIHGGQDDAVVVWDPHTGRRVQQLRGHRPMAFGNNTEATVVCRAAYAPGGRWLATCGQDGTVRLWDAQQGKDYRLVATLGTVGLHSYRANEPAAGEGPLPEMTLRGSLLAVAFSADSKQLIAGGWDAPVRLWDLAELLAELRRPAAELLTETERLTGQRRQGSRLVPIQYNRLVPVADGAAP
jgi:WD40 repeat protein